MHSMQLEGGPVYSVAYAPRGQTVAALCSDKGLRVMDVERGEISCEVHLGADFGPGLWLSSGLSYETPGRILAVGGFRGGGVVLRIVDAASGDILVRSQFLDDGIGLHAVYRVHFIACARQSIAAGSLAECVHMLNARSGERILAAFPAQGVVRFGASSAAYAPDGAALAVGRGPEVLILNAQSGAPLRRVHLGIPRHVMSVAYAPDGQTIAVGCDDGHVLTITAAGETVLTVLSSSVVGIAYTSDGRAIAAGCQDGHLRTVDAQSGTTIADVPAQIGAPIKLDGLDYGRHSSMQFAFEPG